MQDNDVVAHYGSGAIAERLLAAVAAKSGGTAKLTPDMLFPYDQLHGRELAATRDHVQRLAPEAHWHVLDVGSGVGGPARYIAATTGARVSGIDLTPEFVEASRELTSRVGLAHKISFTVGDATQLPYADETFDAAVCLYVGMNVSAKSDVLLQVRRVLKRRCNLLWSEVVTGKGDPVFPLPWAMSPDHSHVVGGDELQELFIEAGFEVLDWRDETDAHVELARKVQQSGVAPSPEHVELNSVVMGNDFRERRMNYIKSLSNGSLRSVAVLARA